ncbi:MAG: hypothetical protein NUV88_02735 [Candidatus Kaiserbacteria bacterium]|nr:hypothetical protein [Candidatus Kaiserbacteria bacterium]
MNPSETYVSQSTAGYGIAAVVAIILNTLLTVAKESYPPLLAAMKSLAHHWMVHGVVIVLTFFVLGYILSKQPFARRMNGVTLAWWLTIATVLGGVGLVVFFLTA